MRMTKEQKAGKAADKRIERCYYSRCCGLAIPIMKIGAVFAHGRALIAQEPGISDEALGQAIADYVACIAVAA